MEARATLRPGQQGTTKRVARFGERPIFARCRYDTERNKRFTTVEPIVDETGRIPSIANQTSTITQTENPTATPIETPATAPTDRGDEPSWKAHELVALRVGFEKAGLRQKVKPAGAKWNPWQRP